MSTRSMWFAVIVVLALAATAAGQPAGGSGSGATPGSAAGSGTDPGSGSGSGAGIMMRPPPAPQSPAEFRQACEAAMQADKDWDADLFAKVQAWHANELLDQSQAAHEADAAEIAKNKKHVILAYAAMWVIAAGFLIFLWRRQQGLRAQIADLKRDLDVAIKDAK